ncbi:MAG: CdaR family protein [Bacilli bacterium]|nr:CdaR family protein [Bacilli bacterium]
MKKKNSKFRIFSRNLGRFIDRKIIMPVTRLIVSISKLFDKSGRKIEKWLSSTNTLLFISLFLALVIFVMIDQKILILTENSAEVLKSRPVHVTYNEESYVIEGLPSTVDVTLIGSKADLYFAKQSPAHDIQVDLTGLKPGTHKVNIKYDQVLPSIDYKINPSVATVIIYPKVSETRALSVDILNQDSLDAKYVIKNIDIDSDKVVIKGAEHTLAEVSSVKALVDIKNLVKQEVGTISLKDVPLKAYDSKGTPVNVEIVPSKIDVKVDIASPSKELPIKVIPTGDLAFGMGISAIESSENKITVYGSEDVLANLKYIPVKIDVDGLKENQSYKMEIAKPVGIKSMSISNITVNLLLDTASSRDINDVNIEYRNLADGYTVQGMSANDTKVSIALKGVKSVIDQLQAEDISAYLDLDGYKEGEYEVPVKVDGSDVKVSYTSKTKKVKIKIIKK